MRGDKAKAQLALQDLLRLQPENSAARQLLESLR
jgi:hypothetical protein